MKKFFKRFGINTKYDKPENNIFINVFLSVVEILYFGISIYNLYYASAFSWVTLTLNCLAFASLILSNVRKEMDHLKNDDRYSLYFFMFALEFMIGLVLLLSLIILGPVTERLKTELLIMFIITFANKVVNMFLNLYGGE